MQVQNEDEDFSKPPAMQSSHSDTSEGNAVTIYTCILLSYVNSRFTWSCSSGSQTQHT